MRKYSGLMPTHWAFKTRGWETRGCNGLTNTHWTFKKPSGLEPVLRCKPSTYQHMVSTNNSFYPVDQSGSRWRNDHLISSCWYQWRGTPYRSSVPAISHQRVLRGSLVSLQSLTGEMMCRSVVPPCGWQLVPSDTTMEAGGVSLGVCVCVCVCNKGCGMCYPVYAMVHIKDPLLLIGKSSLCGGSRCPFSLSEWSLTICLTPYNHK